MDYEELPNLEALRCDKFEEKCDLLIKNKVRELRSFRHRFTAKLAEVENALDTNIVYVNDDDNDVGDDDTDFGSSTFRRPRRTASKTAGLKIKKNLNMPLKLRRPSSGISLSGTLKSSKTGRTKVVRKNDQSNPDSTSNSVDKSINAIDEMNLVKKRTEQFEKMSKDQQLPMTPSRRNEAMNIDNCITSSLDNVNNNVSADTASTTTVVSVENNVVESTITTTTTQRVTRTKTRNMNKQVLEDCNANATNSSSTEEVVAVKSRGGRTKMRKELRAKVVQGVLESEPSKVDSEALAQKEREKELARKAKEKAEEEREAEKARKAEEEAKRIAEKAKRAEEARKAEEEAKRIAEEAKQAEEARKAELAKREKEREREKKKARELEAAAKKKEAEQLKLKALALEKKKQELENNNKKKEAVKKKHEELNKKRELDAKKREELLLASAAKKKEAAEVYSKPQQKVADAKENMKPNQNAKPPIIKPVHPVVNQLKNTTFTSSTYNMTPPRDEREPQKPKTDNDYGIDDAASSDSSDDESNPKKIVPNWAKSSELQGMVQIQSQLPLELFQFMMSCEIEPYGALGYANRIKRPRTSSAVWHTPIQLI